MVLVFLAFCVDGLDDRVPPALREALEGRQAIVTGFLNYTRTHPGAAERYSRAEIAGDSVLLHLDGDSDGMLLGQPIENVIEDRDFSEHMTLVCDGAAWSYGIQGPISADKRELSGNSGVIGLRTLGLVGWPSLIQDPTEALLAEWGDEPPDFATRTEGSVEVVIARKGNRSVEWRLDAIRGHQPIRIDTKENDTVVRLAEFELQEFDGTWFPASAVFQHADAAGVLAETQRIVVHYAEFNRPDHPQELTPAHMGLEVGTNVSAYDKNRRPLEFVQMWNGHELISSAEFAAQLRAGKIRYSDRMLRFIERMNKATEKREAAAKEMEGGGIIIERPASRPAARSLWEPYTREFVQRYRCSEEQAVAAYKILADCQQQAERVASRDGGRLSEYSTIDGKLAMRDEKGVVSSDKSLAKRDVVLVRLESIFLTSLRPRLERLLTREQMKLRPASASAPASMPSR